MKSVVYRASVWKWPRLVGLMLAPIPLGVLLVGWWFTEPFGARSVDGVEYDPSTVPVLADRVDSARPLAELSKAVEPSLKPSESWPVEMMTGDPAKSYMLDYMLELQARMSGVSGYTALFTKQERIGGELRPTTRIRLKIRHEPFSVYMLFVEHEAGREIIYQDGRFENQMIAHNGGLSRRLLPRLRLSPTSALALADNRHPVTEAGLSNLVNKLVNYRRLDLIDEHAVTVLDRYTSEDGRQWYRAQHDHSVFRPDRPFARAVLLFDTESKLPARFEGYEWPEQFQGPSSEGLVLGELYTYEEVDFEATLSDLDFDPANPVYEFTRF